MKNDYFVLFVCAIATLMINMKGNAQETGTFIDTRDSIEYKTVKIGEQWWMAENLKYKPDIKFATAKDKGRMLMRDEYTGKAYVVTFVSYNNDEDNIAAYGYLYDWETACSVCPEGWHLPTYTEWENLIDYLDMKIAGTKMKETENAYWETSKTKIQITNSSGFSALPGGCCNPYLEFSGLGDYAFFWAFARNYKNDIWFMRLDKNKNSILKSYRPKEYYLSVRCLKN